MKKRVLISLLPIISIVPTTLIATSCSDKSFDGKFEFVDSVMFTYGKPSSYKFIKDGKVPKGTKFDFSMATTALLVGFDIPLVGNLTNGLSIDSTNYTIDYDGAGWCPAEVGSATISGYLPDTNILSITLDASKKGYTTITSPSISYQKNKIQSPLQYAGSGPGTIKQSDGDVQWDFETTENKPWGTTSNIVVRKIGTTGERKEVPWLDTDAGLLPSKIITIKTEFSKATGDITGTYDAVVYVNYQIKGWISDPISFTLTVE